MVKRYGAAVLCAIFFATAVHAAVSQKERDALVAVYDATGGAQWTAHDNWNGAAGTECTWYGVYCDDSQSTVTALSINYNNVKGTIPASIADLSNLTGIELQGNALIGAIPSQIGTLAQLEDLDLAYNALTGTIPPSLGSLTHLKHLFLHGNQLTGSIPPQLGNLSLLQDLNFNQNQLTGTLPAELGSLSQLQYFDVGVNGLQGPIPSTYGNLTNLITFAVNSNEIAGSIPPVLGNLTKLNGLYLSDNKLSGTIPASFTNLTALQELDLSYNGLTGPIPSDIGRLAALTGFHLNDNQLSGNLPSSLTSIATLQVLDLSDNNLTGPLPLDIDRLSNLVFLALPANHFSGPVPPVIGRLTKLEDLILYQNDLTGTIPSEIGSLTELKRLVLDDNQFSGPFPESFHNLRNLEYLTLYNDGVTGAIPVWIGDLSKLTFFSVNSNRMTGAIPDSLWTLTSLSGLDLAYNDFSGTIPAAIGNISGLAYLSLSDNELSGVLPDALWSLHDLDTIALDHNQISGPLSGRVSELTKLIYLLLGDNKLTGAIPPELGTMQQLGYLQLYGNQFTGAIPSQLGDLTNLKLLDLGSNDLRGEVPKSMQKLTSLDDSANGWDHNSLVTSDASLLAFLNQKQAGGDFPGTQTVPVRNVSVTATTDRSVTLQWTPMTYGYDYGGYQVAASRVPNGTPEIVTTTNSKVDNSITVRNLASGTTYYFTIRSITFPHDIQHNTVVSDPTPPVTATTAPRANAPADVVVTTQPNGIIEIDGVPESDDTFTLTNYGDVAASITLEPYFDFFTVSPSSFSLAAGASQLVTIKAKPQQAPGAYYGGVSPHGDGVEAEFVNITLLSVSRPAQGAIAEALSSRVDVVEQPGVPAAGTVTFRNRGTVALSGVVQSDVPWIVPPRYVVQLGPGETAAVTFTIDATKRPQVVGTLTGTLTLVYVGGNINGSSNVVAQDVRASASGSSRTSVTVVDTTKPTIAAGTIPPLQAGEVAFAIPGVTSAKTTTSAVASDVDVLNAFGSNPITDLRLYYENASSTSVASLASVGASQSLSFANIVANVYSSPASVGTLQMRTREWQSLLIAGRLLRLNGADGNAAADLPVFRSDRAARAGQSLRLAGVKQGGTLSTTMYIEEMTGAATRVHIDLLNATGGKLAQKDVDLVAFGFAEVANAVPAGAVTAVVTNSGSSGAVVAYARVTDSASGDAWSVVDWRSYFDIRAGSPMLVPFVTTTSGSQSPGNGRRRAVSHATSAPAATEVTMFNGSATDAARVTMQYGSSSKQFVIAAQATMTIDVSSELGASSPGPLRISQDKGDVAMTTRFSRAAPTGGTYGAAVPVLAAQSGLRAGQVRVFANIEDPSAATIAAGTPGTFRDTYGLLETSGAPAVVRVTVSLPDGRTLTDVSKDVVLSSNQFVTFDGVVKSILGDARDTRYGDFHNLQVKFTVLSGNGSVVPFFVVTENASGDSVLRLE